MSQTPTKVTVKRSRSEDSNFDARNAENTHAIVDVDGEDAFQPAPVEDNRVSPCAHQSSSAAVTPGDDERSGLKVPTPPIQKPNLRQAKLFFGPPDDSQRKTIAEKDAIIADKDAAIEELNRRCAALESELASERSASARLNAAASKWESATVQYREVLTEVMKDAARTQRREARRAEHNQHFDLGQILVCQNAIGPRELWVEGNRKRELDVEIQQLTVKIAQVERERKTLLTQQKTNKKRLSDNDDVSNGFSTSDPSLDIDEQLQMLQHSLTALTQAKQDAEMKIVQLQAEKTAFLKEIRRISDEDSSEFANVQSLHNGRYVLLSLLGKGGFSEVWKAFDIVEPKYVACKIHRINKDWTQSTRDHYLKHAQRELHIMETLDHPRLTKLYDIFEQDDSTFVSVQELSEGTDLDTFLKRYGKMKEADARIIMIQLISALRHLADQSSPIIHYDLKPANIIFHSAFPACLDIKVTDFGLSKVIKQAGNSNDPSIELTSQGTGTYWYLPPECFETGLTPPKISSKVDIWAAGIIFYQLLYGKRPFAEGESQKRIWQDKLILSAARCVTFPAEPKVTEQTKEIIQLCLKYNAAERPDIVALSKLPYFKSKAKGSSNTQAARMLPPAAPSSAGGFGLTGAPVPTPTPPPSNNANVSPDQPHKTE